MAKARVTDPLEAAKSDVGAVGTASAPLPALAGEKDAQPDLLPIEDEMARPPADPPPIAAAPVKPVRYCVQSDKKISYRGATIDLRKGDIISNEMGETFVAAAMEWGVSLTRVE
jgi:hypothetical protein